MSVHRDLNTSIKSALTAGNRTIAKEKLYRVMRKTDLMKGRNIRNKWMSSKMCLETGILGFHFFLRQDLLVVSCFRFLKGSSDLEYVKLW